MWGTASASDSLALTGVYQTVQASAVDLVIQLNPGELVQLLLAFNPQLTPTENADVLIQRSHDGTTWESDGEADRYFIEFDNRETDDPAVRSLEYAGIHSLRIRARLRDPGDTVGGTDTGSTLTVHYRQDGVNL